MNTPYDENNLSENNGQGPVIYPEPPAPHIYQGNQGLATASLVLGIFSLVSMCCFPPLALFFGALGLLLGLMSKGTYARPGNGKAGIAISSTGLAIVTAIIIFAFTNLLSTESGKIFLQEYVDILIHPENHSQDDVYELLERYLYGNGGSNNPTYEKGTYPGGEEYNDYDEYQDNGDLPYYSQPEDDDFL